MYNNISIRKLANRMLLFVLIPLILLLTISILYNVVYGRADIISAEQDRLRITVVPLQNELARVEGTIEDLLTSNIAARALSVPSASAQVTINAYVIRTALDTLFNSSNNISMMMFYCPQTNIMITKDDGFPDLWDNDKNSIISGIKASYISNAQSNTLISDEWMLEEISGRMFLRYNSQNDDIYIACLIDIQRLLALLDETSFEDDTVFYLAKDNTILSSDILENNLSTVYEDFVAANPEQNVATSIVSEHFESFELIMTSRPFGAFYGVNTVTIIVGAFTLLVAGFLAVIVLSWKKYFFLPMEHLVQTMKEILDGNMSARTKEINAGQELVLVNTTFNKMLESIQVLKIEKYEQELEMRQIQLQYYQAQIKPHFYLNCLKNLYSLAQQNEMKNIEQSILLLSNHLRYSFNWQTDTVTLLKELQMCQNYINLMGVTAFLKPKLELEIEDIFLNEHVPPVSILSLVENSLKYGLNETKQSVIRITVRNIISEHEQYLQIGIYDNGNGFSPESLKKLNALMSKNKSDSEGHVGIQNVLIRFKLIYADNFNVAFSNQNGGAVELFIKQ